MCARRLARGRVPAPPLPARLTQCRPRCGCVSGPDSGRRRGWGSAPWRAPWRSACWRTGWGRCTRPSAAWRLGVTVAWVSTARPAGAGSWAGRSRGGDDGEFCPLPSAGLAQSLYCWGLHTGAPPAGVGEETGKETASGTAPRPPCRDPDPLLRPHQPPSSAPTSPLPGICIIRQPHFRAT